MNAELCHAQGMIVRKGKCISVPGNDKHMAEDILYNENNMFDKSAFWHGGLHWKKPIAEAEVAYNNKLLKGTGASAHLEFARNFNPRGIDWGISIRGFDEKTESQLKKKYGIE